MRSCDTGRKPIRVMCSPSACRPVAVRDVGHSLGVSHAVLPDFLPRWDTVTTHFVPLGARAGVLQDLVGSLLQEQLGFHSGVVVTPAFCQTPRSHVDVLSVHIFGY